MGERLDTKRARQPMLPAVENDPMARPAGSGAGMLFCLRHPLVVGMYKRQRRSHRARSMLTFV